MSEQREGADGALEKAPEKWFSFLGLVVIRKTDLLAGAAFVLAVSTTMYQVWNAASKPKPDLFHPDTAYIFFDTAASNFKSVRVAGQVSFTNRGDPGRNTIIRSVAVTVKVGDTRFDQQWFSFAKLSRDGGRLNIEQTAPAHPVVIAGGSAASEMIGFASQTRDCAAAVPPDPKCEPDADYVSDDDFLKALFRAQVVDLTFAARAVDSSAELKSSCRIPVTETFKTILIANEWIATRCFPTR